MLTYESQIVLKATPQKAWNSFRTFGAIHEWHPATAGRRLLVGQNGKPPAVREFRPKGGGFVISELRSYDEGSKRSKYRIIKTPCQRSGLSDAATPGHARQASRAAE